MYPRQTEELKRSLKGVNTGMGVSVVITLHISVADSGPQKPITEQKSFRRPGWKLMTCCWKKERGIQSTLEQETESEERGMIRKDGLSNTTEIATRNWNRVTEKSRERVICEEFGGKETGWDWETESSRVATHTYCWWRQINTTVFGGGGEEAKGKGQRVGLVCLLHRRSTHSGDCSGENDYF